MHQRHLALVGTLLLVSLTAAPAGAQAPIPPLPPIGGGGGEQPPPDDGDQPPPEEGERPQPPPPAVHGPVSPAPGSVTKGVDVAHTGFFADDTLVPPLAPRWSKKLSVLDVVAGGGRVFALHTSGVDALDAATGLPKWRKSPFVHGSVGGLALDGDVLFLGIGDTLHAYDAADGSARWQLKPGGGATIGAPVASGGVVYVVASDTLYALRGATGEKLWEQPAPGGALIPALDGDRVYVAGACANVDARSRADGASVWSHRGGCSGGGNETPALHAGRLYTTSSGGSGPPPVFDALSGAVIGSTRDRPLFVDGLAVVNGEATDVASGRQAWRVENGLGHALAIGHDVYGMRDDRVVAVAADSGRIVWQSGRVVDGGVATALAAAPGTLLVGAGGKLTAFSSIYQPAPTAIAGGAAPTDVYAGRDFSVVGVVGRELRTAGARVAIEAASWPRRRFARAGRVGVARDGGFSATFEGLVRNVRVRLRAANGARSRAFTVYAHPRMSFGRPRRAGGGRLAVTIGVRAPRARLAGRSLVLYHLRARTRRLERFGAAPLRGSRGRARATVTFRPLRRVGRRDQIVACIRGQLRLRLGRPTALVRRCGTRRLRAPRR